jgi:anti-anti-sigma factor
VELGNVAQSPLPNLVWKGELTAANAEEVWMRTSDHIAARSLVQKVLVIDLSKLTFIDSTGLSVMIRTKKFAARQQLGISYVGVQENVRNVLRLSRLEEFLLGAQ